MKSKKILFATIMILLIGCLTFSSFAHSGRTDGSGGHYDSTTGAYHYHHGYPAHQHTGGICPYEYDDNTDDNINTNYNSNVDYVDNIDSDISIPSELLVIMILVAIFAVVVLLSLTTKLGIGEIMAHILMIPFYILIAIPISISYIIDKIKNRKK